MTGCGGARTIENAATLPKKFESETARGVRWVMRRMGITGYGAHQDSTITKSTQKTALNARRPQMSGLDQASSSVDLRLSPRRRHPTVMTSVREPKPSILRSLARSGWFSTSKGSLMLTFAMTRMKEKRRTGIYAEYRWKTIRAASVSLYTIATRTQ